MNKKLLLSNSLLLSIVLAVPGFASRPDISDDNDLNPFTSQTQHEEDDSELSVEDLGLLNKSQEAMGLGDLLLVRPLDAVNESPLPVQTLPERKISAVEPMSKTRQEMPGDSRLVRACKRVDEMQAQISMLQQYQDRRAPDQMKPLERPKDLKISAQVRQAYDEDSRTIRHRGQERMLSLNELIKESNKIISDMCMLAKLDASNLTNTLMKKRRDMAMPLFTLMKAFKEPDSFEYKRLYGEFRQLQKQWSEMLAPYMHAFEFHKAQLRTCDEILAFLRQYLGQNKIMDDQLEVDLDFDAFNKVCGQFQGLLNSEQSEQESLKLALINCLDQNVRSNLVLKDERKKNAQRILLRAKDLTKAPEVFQCVFEVGDDSCAMSGRKYAELSVPLKRQRNHVVVPLVAVSRAPAVVAEVKHIPADFDWDEGDWTKLGPKDKPLLISSMKDFDLWLTNLGQDKRKEIITELIEIAHDPSKASDTDFITRNKDNRQVPLFEQRFKHSEYKNLRVYTCLHNGQLYVLAWGTKSNGKTGQNQDIDTADRNFKAMSSNRSAQSKKNDNSMDNK